MDIQFKCSRCGQHLSADEKGAGVSVTCPTCGDTLTVPGGNPQPSHHVAIPPPVRVSNARGSKPTLRRITFVAAVCMCAAFLLEAVIPFLRYGFEFYGYAGPLGLLRPVLVYVPLAVFFFALYRKQ